MEAQTERINDPITLENWLEPPYNRRALQGMDGFLPTATISRGEGSVRAFYSSTNQESIDEITYETEHGRSTIGHFIESSCTDGILILRGETVLSERYLNGLTKFTRHSLMSVSKSLAGMLAGKLIEQGHLNQEMKVKTIIPELQNGPYGDATLRQVLDMGVVLQFRQEYEDPTSEVQTEDRAAGWRPRLDGDPPDTKAFLATLRGETRQKFGFQYCSATTDVLAWVLQRFSGRPYAELMSAELWSQIGAEHDAYVTVDSSSSPYACAGICATLRDVARFGRLILDGGSWNGKEVLPMNWIEQTSHEAGSLVKSDSDFDAIAGVFPEAIYHNQWWTTRNSRGAFFGIGIFGQYLFLDPESDVVIVKFSSLPAPNDSAIESEHLIALDALSRAIAN
jgi:CubicO group peptidase (beta-lactamase class C family)